MCPLNLPTCLLASRHASCHRQTLPFCAGRYAALRNALEHRTDGCSAHQGRVSTARINLNRSPRRRQVPGGQHPRRGASSPTDKVAPSAPSPASPFRRSTSGSGVGSSPATRTPASPGRQRPASPATQAVQLPIKLRYTATPPAPRPTHRPTRGSGTSAAASPLGGLRHRPEDSELVLPLARVRDVDVVEHAEAEHERQLASARERGVSPGRLRKEHDCWLEQLGLHTKARVKALASAGGIPGKDPSLGNEPCLMFRERGSCRFGSRCKFAHITGTGGEL